MSAPKAGRQSPDLEQQHGHQKDPPASGLTGAGVSMDLKELNKKQLESLPSNPEHPLAQASEQNTSKKCGTTW
jgi:hypothetical protein